jgi:hypothetical protein
MADILCAASDGDNTAAATWQIVDLTSANESESNTIVVPTTYATTYTPFAPGVITIDGIGVRLSNRTGTTGTFSVELYNTTLGASVAGTEVTIDCADFSGSTTARLNGGWYFFKFASPVVLLAATNYIVRFKTSSATQISLFGSTATTPSKFVRTTTTKSPTTGDNRIVVGEWTAAGTTVTRTVTLDDTGAAIDYGGGATSIVTPALSIGGGGIVLAGTTASTTYVQKISGNVVVYNGGILRIAASGSEMPTSSSFTWTFDCVANCDFGIDVRPGGEFTAYGESKQRWTLLTSNKAAASTSIQVVSTSGWNVGDVLLFAPTGTSATQGEIKTILTVDSPVQVTLSAGLTNAHTGTGDCVGEVGNLTSNVKIVGKSTTVGTFVCFRESSIAELDNVEVQYYGSLTNSRRGVEIQHLTTSTNSGVLNSCSFRDCISSGGVGAYSNGSLFYITNNIVSSSVSTTAMLFIASSTTPTSFNVSGNLMSTIGISGTLAVNYNSRNNATCTFENNNIAGFTTAISVTTVYIVITEVIISGCKIHSCTNGISSTTSQKKTVSLSSFVCCANGALGMCGHANFISCDFIGNSTAGFSGTLGATLWAVTVLTSCTFRGRTSFAQASGIVFSSAYNHASSITLNNCTFGVSIAHTAADVNITASFGGTVILNNCTLASTNEVNSTAHTFLDESALIALQRIDGTTENHRTHVMQAIITPDSTISRTASPSLRITPKSSTIPCNTSLFSFKVPVNSGQACTPVVYVRESEAGDGAAYNGSRVDLYVKANYNLGITSDTLLATATAASDGAWEGLTGTTATVADAGVLEFYVVCNGTTGWINIDDFTATNA